MEEKKKITGFLAHKRRILKTQEQILKEYSDVLGLVLIGSVAEGSYKKDSDIDIVCIKSRRVGFERRHKFMDKLSDEIQLVTFTKRQILEHFKNSTTMAYSIRNGMVFYQRNGFIDSLFKKRLSKPNIGWMKRWFKHWLRFYRMGLMDRRRNKRFHKSFCRNRCHCQVSDHIVRATVNFAILYLETKGIIPTSKSKILIGLENISNKKFLRGLRIALVVHRQHRDLDNKEAESVFYTANWLKQRLQKKLISGDCRIE